MEKRLVAAILLTIVFLFLYSTFFQPPEELAELPAEKEPERVIEQEREEIKEEPDLPEPEFPIAEAKEIVVESDLYRAVLSSAGAKIKSFRLKNYSERFKDIAEIEGEISTKEERITGVTSDLLTVRNRLRNEANDNRQTQLEEREENLNEELASLEQEKKALSFLKHHVKERKGEIAELESKLKETADSTEQMKIKERLKGVKGVELIPPEAMAFGKLPPSVKIPTLNADINRLLFKPDKGYLKLTEDESSLEFRVTVNEGVEIKKRYTFKSDNYAIDIDLEIKNLTDITISEESASLAFSPGIGLVESAPGRGVITGIVSYVDGNIYTDRFSAGRSDLAPGIPKFRAGEDVWTAIKAKYFAAALIPHYKGCIISSETLPEGGQKIGLRHPAFTVEPGDTFSKSFTMYLGPQDSDALKKANPSLEKIIDYGFWSPVARVIDRILSFFYSIFNNFGVAIILLSLTVKIVFYPLTQKSFKSMKKMQDDMKALQPKMDELKKKYGNNQQKLNKAMMEMYKKEGVNPMSSCKGGCFPMLLQMPVFFALYAVLNTSIDLRGAHFIAWITDLSAPDPLRILPVLMGISMFWQQKLSGTGAGPQQEQAKMMQWMMPIMLTFIFFGLPSGIVLYWFSFNIFTTLQQMLIRKHGA